MLKEKRDSEPAVQDIQVLPDKPDLVPLFFWVMKKNLAFSNPTPAMQVAKQVAISRTCQMQESKPSW